MEAVFSGHSPAAVPICHHLDEAQMGRRMLGDSGADLVLGESWAWLQLTQDSPDIPGTLAGSFRYRFKAWEDMQPFRVGMVSKFHTDEFQVRRDVQFPR
jgi:hypothetical protein